jgi:MFS family permease
MGQVVSEIGDHFNNIAVFDLALKYTGSGMVVTGVMLSRAVPAILIGPFAGVVLDRLDRKRIMIISDLVRAIIAIGFIGTLTTHSTGLLYVLSALLMAASPFFTAGRSSIMPTIASKEELRTANSLTQTTQWTTITIGTFAGGAAVAQFGFEWAFVLNAFSFLFSAFCISKLSTSGGFQVRRDALNETKVVRPWHDYMEGLAYIRQRPLITGIALISVGWATGGGAAQILFTLFGEIVFKRGAAGIGIVWGSAGMGLLVGGAIAHWMSKRISFSSYKKTVGICYAIHGLTYILFAREENFYVALIFIGASRAAVAISSVMNTLQLLRHVSDEYRGRVFATNETLSWTVMMMSMMAAGIASQHYSPREIGVVAGILSGSTAIFWSLANALGKLPEPALSGVDPREVEVHEEKGV